MMTSQVVAGILTSQHRTFFWNWQYKGWKTVNKEYMSNFLRPPNFYFVMSSLIQGQARIKIRLRLIAQPLLSICDQDQDYAWDLDQYLLIYIQKSLVFYLFTTIPKQQRQNTCCHPIIAMKMFMIRIGVRVVN